MLDILISLAWMTLWVWGLYLAALGLGHLAHYLLKNRE